ncbi:uncharacterized protein [Eurosta solidaginis]|uniref:uncharacterized protein n=1 Tax=Eurosta solidaginis TaxID=178769 RepID=UPI003531397B
MDINEKMELLIQETTLLRKEVGQLKDALTKQNCKIVRLIKDQCNVAKQQEKIEQARRSPDPVHRAQLDIFPIKTQDDLESAEINIKEDNRREYIALAKALLMPGSFKKNLHKILGIDIIVDYNVDGRHNKKRILDYPNLLDVLYQATTKEGWNYKYFLDDLRLGFKCAKNKQFKLNWTQKQKHIDEPIIKIEEVLIPYDD